MVLTRQIEVSLAEGSQWLEELGAVCGMPEEAGATPPAQAQELLRST